MHTKEFYDWIKTELKIAPEADTIVLDFIYRFRTYLNGVNNLAESILISQFKKGYCYKIAAKTTMLASGMKAAFLYDT